MLQEENKPGSKIRLGVRPGTTTPYLQTLGKNPIFPEPQLPFANTKIIIHSFIRQIIAESLLHARNCGMSETHTVPCPRESDIRARKTDDKTREQTNKIFSSHNEHREGNSQGAERGKERRAPALGKSSHAKGKKEPAMHRGEAPASGQSEGRRKDPRKSGNHKHSAWLVCSEGIRASDAPELPLPCPEQERGSCLPGRRHDA